jgi:hypothetical protein
MHLFKVAQHLHVSIDIIYLEVTIGTMGSRPYLMVIVLSGLNATAHLRLKVHQKSVFEPI